MTFVDSSAWYALYVPADERHLDACRWMSANRGLLFTTDYVIDETLTLLRSRGHREIAIDFGTTAFKKVLSSVYLLTPKDIDAAWQVFHDFDDKDWSFTDCTSKVVIEQFGIETAFTFDHHFRQFGTVVVVP